VAGSCKRGDEPSGSGATELAKAVPLHATRTVGRERRNSSYSFSTSALDGVSGQRHAPAALYTRGEDPQHPLDRKLGGPQIRSGHKRLEEKSLRLCRRSNLSRPVVQPVAIHYTD
jgi:hypothetical protein